MAIGARDERLQSPSCRRLKNCNGISRANIPFEFILLGGGEIAFGIPLGQFVHPLKFSLTKLKPQYLPGHAGSPSFRYGVPAPREGGVSVIGILLDSPHCHVRFPDVAVTGVPYSTTPIFVASSTTICGFSW